MKHYKDKNNRGCEIIRVKNFPEDFIVKRSARKTLSLSISRTGVIKISAPKQCSTATIERFIISRSEWIDSHLSEIRQILKENSDIITYQNVFYLGKRYSVVYIYGLEKITLNKDKIFIPEKFKKSVYKYLKEWYLLSFNEIVVERTNMLLKKLNIRCKEISAIDSVRVWGWCKASIPKIAFNYKLVMLDQELIDYVIVHEVCHLMNMSHNKEFWGLVENILPDYRQCVSKLKSCSILLKLTANGIKE